MEYFRCAALGVMSFVVLLTTSCATQTRYYSSTVDYLYPGRSDPVETASIPVLQVPIKVGIAFVPDAGTARQRSFWQDLLPGASAKPPGLVLTEKQKTELMQEAADHFRKYPYIGKIELIPSSYLRPSGSFANLDQIRSMYGIDAVALLAYDQVQFTDEGAASFLYWTIVGAYTVPGEKNTTHTMMDAVVYDIKSRKMLFRAPGVSQVQGKATPVNLSEELRTDSVRGFEDAAQELIANLDAQLATFKDQIKQSPEQVKLVYRPGYTGAGGGGSVDGSLVALLALLAAVKRIRYRCIRAADRSPA